jgi:hypothetical protein
MGSEGAAALSRALLRHTTMQSLNIKANMVNEDGAFCVAGMLKENHSLVSLHLAENWIGAKVRA